MALNAERLDVRVIQKLFVFRAMGSVTAKAVQRQIGIAWINDLGSDGVGRVSLPIVALGTGSDGCCLFL